MVIYFLIKQNPTYCKKKLSFKLNVIIISRNYGKSQSKFKYFVSELRALFLTRLKRKFLLQFNLSI